MAPAISFIVPVWNREASIEAAVRSCLTTTGNDVEVIVVDDASTDGSVEKIKKINDPRVRLIEHDHNKGVCAARSTGIYHAASPWIALLDSDDEMAPGAVDRLRLMLNGVASDLGVFAARILHDSGLVSPPNLPYQRMISFEQYLHTIEINYPINCDFFICMRRSALEQVHYPTERVPELEFNLKIAYVCGAALTSEVLYLCHEGAANQLTRKGNAVAHKDHDMARIRAYDRILQAYPEQMRRYAPTLRQRMIERMIIGTATVGGRRAVLRLVSRFNWPQLSQRLRLLLAVAFIAPKLPDWLRRRRWR